MNQDPQPAFDDAALGHAIAKARAARGMTLDDLAAASGLSRRMLSYIEAGESSPTAGKLHSLAHALSMPVGQLVQYGCVDGAPTNPDFEQGGQ